jgi:hypothetical protein
MWSGKPVGTDIFETLREKANLPQWDNFKKKEYAIFSRSGFTKAVIEEAKSDRSLILVSGDKRIA